MTREQATEAIRAAREETGLTWRALAEAVGRSPVWTTAALLGQGTMSAQEAASATEALGLGADVAAALQRPPTKGSLDTAVPVDPLIYRFHEITQVYGTTIKELIHEEFGDGIMSAIDFEMRFDPAWFHRPVFQGSRTDHRGDVRTLECLQRPVVRRRDRRVPGEVYARRQIGFEPARAHSLHPVSCGGI